MYIECIVFFILGFIFSPTIRPELPFNIAKVQTAVLQYKPMAPFCFNGKSVAIRGLFPEGHDVKDIILPLQRCFVGY